MTESLAQKEVFNYDVSYRPLPNMIATARAIICIKYKLSLISIVKSTL
ncbi:MAG: hypothetical protein IIW54_16270 [Lachnospiraceae bacterium]|nr:hypothetical protein [Lachnospiraceae bacterium]